MTTAIAAITMSMNMVTAIAVIITAKAITAMNIDVRILCPLFSRNSPCSSKNRPALAGRFRFVHIAFYAPTDFATLRRTMARWSAASARLRSMSVC